MFTRQLTFRNWFLAFVISVISLSATAQGEMKGIWISDPTGYDWDKVIHDLKKSGLNTLFVNFASAGVAFYPSKVLPVKNNREPFDKLIRVAKANGIEIHAKILAFFMYWAPRDLMDQRIREKRVLIDVKGQPNLQANTPWLDPGVPENREQVHKVIEEILTLYPDLDGLQLDYIRYFEEVNVPENIMKVRQNVVTKFVQDLGQKFKNKWPEKRLSACVFYNLHRAQNEMAQDWKLWNDLGIFHFLIPMNYTTDLSKLHTWLYEQKRLQRGGTTLYSGLGAYMTEMTPKLLLKQIALVKQARLPGYVLFAYNDDFVKKYGHDLKEG